jgi:hypothetical protein
MQAALTSFTTDDIATIERDQKYNLPLDGETFELLIE